MQYIANIQLNKKKIMENLSKVDHITLYDNLNNFLTINSGLTTKECVQKIDFHQFTEESFEYLIMQINANRNTYHNIGPFKKNTTNYTWYNENASKLQTIENLLRENVELKEEANQLKTQIRKFLNSSNFQDLKELIK